MSVTHETYVNFLQKVAPDRKCHVCGNDDFGVVMEGENPALLAVPASPRSSVPGNFDCFAHYCTTCGTITITAAHLLARSAPDV